MKLHFSKRATEVSTALRCLSCFLCFFPFTTVARGSSLWSLTCIPDRQKKSTQPVAVGEASSLPSSPAISVLKTPARSPPSSTRLQHRSKDTRLRHYGSCQAVVCQSCLQMVIQALSSGAWVNPVLQPSENIYAAVGWMDGGTASHFLAPPPLPLLKLPVWSLEDESSQSECSVS